MALVLSTQSSTYFPIFSRLCRQRFTLRSGVPAGRSCSTMYHFVPPVVSQIANTSFQSILPSPITAVSGPPDSLRWTVRDRPGNRLSVAIGSPPASRQLPRSICMTTSSLVLAKNRSQANWSPIF